MDQVTMRRARGRAVDPAAPAGADTVVVVADDVVSVGTRTDGVSTGTAVACIAAEVVHAVPFS